MEGGQVILVTGAAGHIGNALVRYLVEKGEKVRAMVMPKEDTSCFSGIKVEVVRADITCPDTLEKVFQGVDYVYHLAGIVTLEIGRGKLLHRVNVGGTKNIIEACWKYRVKRLVYFSSVHAFVEPKGEETLSEKAGFDYKKSVGKYAQSKAQASQLVQDAAKSGLDTVIVAPVGVIGPYDFKLSEMGQVLSDFYFRRLKILIRGAYDFVDVRDVARGAVLACKKGKTGESYILSGGRITIKRVVEVLARNTGILVPRWTVPTWLAKLFAVFTPVYYFLLRQKPVLTLYSINTLNVKYKISDKKARQELGYVSRPIEESLTDTILWLKKNKWYNEKAKV